MAREDLSRSTLAACVFGLEDRVKYNPYLTVDMRLEYVTEIERVNSVCDIYCPKYLAQLRANVHKGIYPIK